MPAYNQEPKQKQVIRIRSAGLQNCLTTVWRHLQCHSWVVLMAVVWNCFPKMHFQVALPQVERLLQKIRRCLQRMERKNAFSNNQKVNFEVKGDTGFVLMLSFQTSL